MRRVILLFCAVLLCSVAVMAIARAASDMGAMPMPAASTAPVQTAAQSADAGNPWPIATFVLAAFAIIGIAVVARDRRPVTIAVFGVAVLAIVLLAFFQARTQPGGAAMGSMEAARGIAAIPVTTVHVRADRTGGEISAPANVAPYFVQTVAARVPGVLTGLSTYAGDRVKAGQILARLDEPELQSNAQAALADARAAQSAIHRAQDGSLATNADVRAARERVRYWDAEIARERALLDQGAVSPQEYQDEKAQAVSAQSAYDAARAKAAASVYDVQAAQAQAAGAAANAQSQSVTAGYTNVSAPDNAIVMKRLVDPGTYVSAGTPILQVAVLNRLRVQAQIAQQDLPAVHIGTPIDIVLGDGAVLHGRVNSISPVADPATHTAIAEAVVQNLGGAYQPGGYVRTILHVETNRGAGSFSVPSAAIIGGEHAAVWIDAGGMAHRVAVTVLSDDGTSAWIRGKLRTQDRVVVTGAADLEEGQAITESPR